MKVVQRIARKGLSFSSIGQTLDLGTSFSRGGEFMSGLTSMRGDREQIEANFPGYVQRGYKANGIVWTCILVRLQVFSQAMLRYQDIDDGTPGALSWGAGLSLLDEPWANGTSVELLTRMEQDASLAGNFYATPVTGKDGKERVRRLRPDWVTIITGSPTDDPYDINAEVIGYLYEPKEGPRLAKPTLLLPGQVVHWSPIPDPLAQWRGMSWLTPVLREIEGDSAATKHKGKFYENGATSNFVITWDKDLGRDRFLEVVDLFDTAYGGVESAYKTIHLGAGADARTVGADMKQLDFKATQGAGETRIAAASGVGAIIAQFSEGMQGSSLNAGNYGAARRRYGDITMQHSWRSATASLAKIASVPDGKRLWFDASDIPFLQEDQKDAAAIVSVNAATIGSLVKEGFTADSATEAVTTGDLTKLVHTGLVSVQLQTPGSITPEGDTPPQS